MNYTKDAMFLLNPVGTFDWNAEKELSYKEETVPKDDTDTRLIDVLGMINDPEIIAHKRRCRELNRK